VKFRTTEKIGIPYKLTELKAKYQPHIRVQTYRWPYSSLRKNEFHMIENRPEQARLLAKLVKEEGPIHFEYAVKRLADAWGLKRTGTRVVNTVKDVIRICQREGVIRVKGDFLWHPHQQDVTVRTSVSGIPDSLRKPEYIPPEEIENAMELIVGHAISLSVDSLITETVQVFGFHRTGHQIQKELLNIYKKMVEKGRLVCKNNIVTLPEAQH